MIDRKTSTRCGDRATQPAPIVLNWRKGCTRSGGGQLSTIGSSELATGWAKRGCFAGALPYHWAKPAALHPRNTQAKIPGPVEARKPRRVALDGAEIPARRRGDNGLGGLSRRTVNGSEPGIAAKPDMSHHARYMDV